MFSALETATKMIVISDNTATNMLIKRLGGKELLNQRFQQWGLANTKINNLLPDLEGTNTTTPKDLAVILGFVNQGDILSLRSRDRVLEIMRQTKTRTLLPQGLGEGASIAHKTGDIGTVLGDAGVIDMPNGKRYLASVLVTRPHNDIRGRTLIQEISRTIYNYLETHPDQPLPASTPTPTTDN
jgi:beta-lactamase class A